MKHAGICPAVSAVQSCWWGSWCFIMGLLATLLLRLEPNCKLIKKGMTDAKSPRLWKSASGSSAEDQEPSLLAVNKRCGAQFQKRF